MDFREELDPLDPLVHREPRDRVVDLVQQEVQVFQEILEDLDLKDSPDHQDRRVNLEHLEETETLDNPVQQDYQVHPHFLCIII